MTQYDEIRSPYDNAVVGIMPVAGESEVEAAILAAQKGFQTMRRLPRFVRADILQRAVELVRSRKDEFVRFISAEAGKPLFDARGEVSRAIFNLSNAAAEARRAAGDEIPLDGDAGIFEYQATGETGAPFDLRNADLEEMQAANRRVGIARRYPIGPILAIAPFNFPLNLVLHKVAPALGRETATQEKFVAFGHVF
jgi:glyceraldehyde-3-phosphate dehydrogenase (NADP+)